MHGIRVCDQFVTSNREEMFGKAVCFLSYGGYNYFIYTSVASGALVISYSFPSSVQTTERFLRIACIRVRTHNFTDYGLFNIIGLVAQSWRWLVPA